MSPACNTNGMNVPVTAVAGTDAMVAVRPAVPAELV
jgi:hypothetical protein